MDNNLFNLFIMIIVGAIAGTLAARVMRGANFGFLINAILGIAGAVVGGYIFDFFGHTPGSGIVRMIEETFGVSLPENLVGMLISATIGAIVILFAFRIFRGRK